MVDIKSYKLDYIPQAFEPNVKLYIKLTSENFVREYITSSTGVPIPLKDETGGSTSSLIRDDFTYTSGAQIFTLSQDYGQVYSVEVQGQGALSQSQYTLVSPNKVQILDTLETGNYIVVLFSTGVALFSPTLNPIVNLVKVSGENIPSYTPIAVVDNLAYKLDAGNVNHKFAFVGFAVNGTITGQNCIIQQQGEVTLMGWGLVPNAQYLSSTAGAITTDNVNPLNFTKVIGYATTANTLQIIKDYTTTIK